ncbi:MAG: hypothetical protein ACFFG0_04590 [Candidatus Thorarchaeota archaeon]
MPSGTKAFFKQAAAPTGWTVDDTIQDNSIIIYRTSGNYGVDGGSQDPTSMATPAQKLNETYENTHQASSTAKVGAAGSGGVMSGWEAAGATWIYAVSNAVNSVSLTPKYTHAIVATKD